MIVELVEFAHPEGSTRAQARAGALATVERWRHWPGLQRKDYLLSTDGQRGAGVYFWPDEASARRAHDADWIAQTEQRTGQPVRITYYELLMTLDNVAGTLEQGDPHP